jgi:hypothetical protein
MNLKTLFKYNRLINSKEVPVEGITYFKAGTDTACSFTIEETQFHLFDGSSTFREWVNNFLAMRVGLFGSAIGYDETAEKLFNQMASKVDESKRQVYGGISRGGALAVLCLVRDKRYRHHVKQSELNYKLISFNMPKAGGKRFYNHCKKLDFQHLRILMKGDVVHKIVWWWKNMWTTELLVLKNREKGIIKKHLNLDNYLPNEEV